MPPWALPSHTTCKHGLGWPAGRPCRRLPHPQGATGSSGARLPCMLLMADCLRCSVCFRGRYTGRPSRAGVPRRCFFFFGQLFYIGSKALIMPWYCRYPQHHDLSSWEARCECLASTLCCHANVRLYGVWAGRRRRPHLCAAHGRSAFWHARRSLGCPVECVAQPPACAQRAVAAFAQPGPLPGSTTFCLSFPMLPCRWCVAPTASGRP